MTDHLRLLYKINDPAVIHLLCLNRQIFFVINKPDIYFTSIAYWLIFLGFFCQFLDLFEYFVLGFFKMPEDPEDGKKFQKTRVKTVSISSFSENWQKKKHPLKYELPSIPPKKVESNDSVNSYLVPYWNKNLTCR